jgi:crossover junction endodeoxyribonuclease RusA
MTLILLPWPPSSLNPNQRQHWRKHAAAKKSYRAACAWQARHQGVGCITAEKIAVSLVFVPPDRRRRDLDNLIASMKSGLDGLADALGVDDNRFSLAAEMAEGPGGFVRVRVVAE